MIREFEYKIKEADAGKTIGDIIRRRFDISSHLLSYLKNHDGILLNDVLVTVRKVGSTGDILKIVIRDKKSKNIVPVNLPLDILYEDEDILAVNKGINMPVHPSINNYTNTLGNAVMYYYRDCDFTFRPVNRLDRDTTGIVIIAKNMYAADKLSQQMRKGMLKKYYYALADGILDQKMGIIDAPIAREKESMIKRCVSLNGKPARTGYKVVREYDGKSLVDITLYTGRTHQIRVHFSYIGHPLSYDYLYGEEVSGRSFILHCRKIELFHPVSGEKMIIASELDDKINEM